jgi:hypothetical protein
MFRLACACAAAIVIGGCASTPKPDAVPVAVQRAPDPPAAPAPAPAHAPKLAAPAYKCDQGIAFDAKFADGSVELRFADREPQTLLRDAGGTSAQNVVYSSTALKAEFGLDPGGRGVKLNFAQPPVEARCVRD